MPFVRRRRIARRSFRRRYAGRRKFVRRVRRVPRSLAMRPTPNIFPKTLKRAMRYVKTDLILATGANSLTPTANAFRANGIFECNASAAAGQPLGFDQLAVLYHHYTVIGSRITVRFVNGTGAATTCLVGITNSPNGNVNTITSGDWYKELGDATTSATVSGLQLDPNAVTLRKTFSMKKFFGGASISQGNLQGTPSSDPTEGSFFIVWVAAADAATAAQSIRAIVTIDYVVVWHEPALLTES